MSYKIYVKRLGANTWWGKTFNPIYFNGRGKSLQEATDIWEKMYYPIERNRLGYAVKVIFPSESEATMFVLRWN